MPVRPAAVVAALWVSALVGLPAPRAAASVNLRPELQGNGLSVAINQIDLSEYPKLKLYVTATGSDGQPVAGLTASAFQALEDGQAKTPLDVSAVSAAPQADPVRIVLALDTSQSVRNSMDKIKDAAVSFVSGLSPRDKIALLSFNDQVTEVQTFTNNIDVIRDRIRALQPGGGTALYEIIYRAAEKVAGESGRRAVVILTDGWNDTDLPRTLKDATKKAVDANAPTYVIGFGSAHHAVLTQIGTDTGGRYLRTGAADEIKSLFTQLTGILASQYILTYDTKLVADSKSHDFRVTLNHNGATAENTKSLLITPSSLPTADARAAVTKPAPVVPVVPRTVASTVACLQRNAAGACVCEDANGDGKCDKNMLAWILGGLFGALLLGWLIASRRRGSASSRDDDWSDAGQGGIYTPETDIGQAGATPMPGAAVPIGASAATGTVVAHRPQGATAWLIGMGGDVGNRRFPLNASEQGTTTFGRAPENSHVVEGGGTISRQHANVRCEHGQFVIRDMGARNPVKVNGKEITRHVLADGDQVELGAARFVFKRAQTGR